ncbi:MAG TPA: signal peptide peptidase SppA [Candidatus Syntrophosphaera sp.]|jgi:protease-4|nr:signal peptide peptidase SppA [Candidatus Syntrophosphaera sp.]HPK82865.1 signal peptide peptidase SppA [Candidatus Syntrophosphaera sp.]HQG94033.1 signal peptide peptidase SppA [Candidatus Syntrophosphaera sp.]HQK29150.1 signal peptide peptidase SppA [Candidatus Syntrophosphaera sp.]
MKTRTGIMLGCGLVLLILIGAFVAGYFIGRPFMSATHSTTISSGTWLVLDPSGGVPDYSELQGSEFWGLSPLSAEDIYSRIRKAAKDSKVKGIIIKPSGVAISYPNLNEISAAMEEFKKSGKTVIAHGETLDQSDYLLCTLADKIYMDPSASGGLLLQGVSSNILFYREALKKLGIKMHVMQSGDYKGAGEPFTQTSLSPGTEANLRRALESRYNLLRSDISRRRGLDSTLVRDIYEGREDLIINGKEAKTYGLIDDTLTWDEMLFQYKIGDDNRVSFSDYASPVDTAVSGNRIAVVNLSGNIAATDGYRAESMISANKVDRILDDIEDDNSIKAVVLRVNSPGGSALESELIYQRLKALKIPVVVSMGGMAASGGYYIACGGDYIYADPHTITGSIGVIMVLPEPVELGNKLGIDSQTLSYGKFAEVGSIFEPYSDELLASLKRESKRCYAEFRQRVMDSRKITPDGIDAVSEGRVFIAADALENGLIDAIGSLDDAVKKAASLANISKYSVSKYPQRISVWKFLRDRGLFRRVHSLLRLRDSSPEERLLASLRDTLKPRQWLYFCPFELN